MRKHVIEAVLRIKRKNFLKLYRQYLKDMNLPIEEQEKRQMIQFRVLFNYAKINIPYYKNLFEQLNLEAKDFKTLKDLEKIPILEKNEIIRHYDSFKPLSFIEPYSWGSTGGSTGEPLRYRISLSCSQRNAALLTRGFSYAGYEIGDKMAIIAGSSLMNANKKVYGRLNDFLFNKRYYSSYGMSEKDLERIYLDLMKWQPKYIRGYATSLALFASYFASRNKREVFRNLKAIFSTAEMLSHSQRTLIEKTFNVKVYNQYGLNDGGISAFEANSFEDSMLIDTERGILEVVDSQGKQIYETQGNIIATSLYNYAFPFIRYNTNDIGTVTAKYSTISTPRLRLINLSGRQTDYIVLNGKTIGSPVLTVLMGKVDVRKYQIIQKDDNYLQVRIEKNDNYDKTQEDFIRRSLFNNVGSFKIEFDYSGNFKIGKNKFKFIIDERK